MHRRERRASTGAAALPLYQQLLHGLDCVLEKSNVALARRLHLQQHGEARHGACELLGGTDFLQGQDLAGMHQEHRVGPARRGGFPRPGAFAGDGAQAFFEEAGQDGAELVRGGFRRLEGEVRRDVNGALDELAVLFGCPLRRCEHRAQLRGATEVQELVKVGWVVVERRGEGEERLLLLLGGARGGAEHVGEQVQSGHLAAAIPAGVVPDHLEATELVHPDPALKLGNVAHGVGNDGGRGGTDPFGMLLREQRGDDGPAAHAVEVVGEVHVHELLGDDVEHGDELLGRRRGVLQHAEVARENGVRVRHGLHGGLEVHLPLAPHLSDAILPRALGLQLRAANAVAAELRVRQAQQRVADHLAAFCGGADPVRGVLCCRLLQNLHAPGGGILCGGSARAHRGHRRLVGRRLVGRRLRLRDEARAVALLSQ
mmetsp:Transcript_8956/g.26011  ORF Transcript_8956/g.26011 Transcript_8956/m.26011 type:complete len:429 (-) Transcript_8956:594-1880(-)